MDIFLICIFYIHDPPHQFKIENLPSGSEFKVNVFARNEKGISDKTEVTILMIMMMIVMMILMMMMMLVISVDVGDKHDDIDHLNLSEFISCISISCLVVYFCCLPGSILDDARGNGDW